MSKNAVAAGSSSSDPIEGLSKATNDRPQGSKTSKTSHSRTSSNSLPLLALSRSSSCGLSEHITDGNRDSQQSTKAGTANEDDNKYDNDNDNGNDNDNETIRAIAKRHSSSHSSHTNMHTDGGRHSNDWLFKPLAKKVKTIFGGKE
jgi:hypothetical protein